MRLGDSGLIVSAKGRGGQAFPVMKITNWTVSPTVTHAIGSDA